MRAREFACQSLALIVLWAATGSVPVRAQVSPATSAVAPADEYFGRLKMSILGIANTIKDMKARIEADATRTPSIFGSLENVEDAIHDWEKKYPRDSWIAKDLYALEVVYAEARDSRAPTLAIRIEHWLESDYPSSPWTPKSRDVIAHMPASPAPSSPQPIADATAPAK
jgi:hypothetical protein